MQPSTQEFTRSRATEARQFHMTTTVAQWCMHCCDCCCCVFLTILEDRLKKAYVTESIFWPTRVKIVTGQEAGAGPLDGTITLLADEPTPQAMS